MCQQWGGGSKRSHTDSCDNSNIYTPFLNTGTELLSSTQVARGLRTRLMNSRTKAVLLMDPLAYGFSSDVKASIIDLYNKDSTGGRKISECRLRMQNDSYTCNIWAMWMHEKWIQHWMLENTHITLRIGSSSKYRTYQRQLASGNTILSKCRVCIADSHDNWRRWQISFETHTCHIRCMPYRNDL